MLVSMDGELTEEQAFYWAFPFKALQLYLNEVSSYGNRQWKRANEPQKLILNKETFLTGENSRG